MNGPKTRPIDSNHREDFLGVDHLSRDHKRREGPTQVTHTRMNCPGRGENIYKASGGKGLRPCDKGKISWIGAWQMKKARVGSHRDFSVLVRSFHLFLSAVGNQWKTFTGKVRRFG